MSPCDDSSSHPILAAQNLSAVFNAENDQLVAIENLTFSVCMEEFVCVLGPSGCGKTTLLRLLAGLLRPTQGLVLSHGAPLTGPRRGAGIVFQKANLMPWRTVLENISLPLEIAHVPPEQARARAREMIELVGLEAFTHNLPGELSGGMAQRVAIARALVADPDVLLMDEPFGALDALTRERMGAELLNLWEQRRKTVVMVTHSISEALLLADRVLVLSARPGRLKLDLTVELPRPRSQEMRYTPAFQALARYLRSAIE